MKRIFLLMAILLSFSCCAQLENVWVFGYKAGIDFNNGSPVAIETSINANLAANYTLCFGAASVCADDGKLLFYTDGSYIWDSTHNMMPNGLWLAPTPVGWPPVNGTQGSTTHMEEQGTVIVPMPGSPEKYYIFSKTLFGYTSGFSRQLYYSVVDMSLNNGKGDVVSNQKSIFLDSCLMSSMTAVAGNNCNVWLLTRKQDFFNRVDSFFQAYEITASGVNPQPVVSTGVPAMTTGANSYIYGMMSVSGDRTKIADTRVTTDNNSTIPADLGLYDFDPNTGLVSNEALLSVYSPIPFFYSTSSIRGIAFSEDNSKLYACGQAYYNGAYQFHAGIYQFNMNAANPAAILGSQSYLTKVYNSTLKMGPDHKIYYNSKEHFVNGIQVLTIGRIESPDLPGLACNPQADILTLLPGTSGILFPNAVVKPVKDTLYQSYNPKICVHSFYDSLVLEAGNGKSFVWDDGSTDSLRTVSQPGTYYVTYRDICQVRVDTFQVTPVDMAFSLGADSGICGDSRVMLEAAIPGANYNWQDGSSLHHFLAATTGNYWVTVNKDGCRSADTVYLVFKNTKQELGMDTFLCKDKMAPEGFLLKADVPQNAITYWSTGSNDPEIRVREPGLYWVAVVDPPCITSDTIRIDMQRCDCELMVPSAFSPNKDGLNDYFLPVLQHSECLEYLSYTLSVYNRWGQRVYEGRSGGSGWDGTYNNTPADAGNYYYYLSYLRKGSTERMNLKGDITLVR